MKIFAFAFAILVAGASAVPTDVETKITERIIDGIIADLIADVSQNIRDAGLDPLDIPRLSEVYRLPVTNLLNVEVLVENLASRGLSEIVINHINYGILSSRLTMDVSLPKISISAKSADVDTDILGWNFKAGVSGSLAIIEPRVNAEVRINLGIISGISIRSLAIDFSLAGVESDLSVNIQGKDFSEAINTFAGATLPNALAANRGEINELLEHITLLVLDGIL